MKLSQIISLKDILIFAGLVFITIGLNFQIISYNVMIFEQSMLYAANNGVNHFSDLIHLYTNPKLLHWSIAFFRPSGHYLMYFLLVPLFGWHNLHAFFIVNLLFLALCGWLMIRIYRLVFPGFYAGGFIAYAIYLMHPAMMLSRLTILHFEYAAVFFILASLYCFIVFCRQNENVQQFKHFTFLVLALLLFAIGVTFKEVDLMIGPMLFLYFCLMRQPESFVKFISNNQTRRILLLLTVSSLALFFYVTWPWGGYFHSPLQDVKHQMGRVESFKQCIGFILGVEQGSSTYSFGNIQFSVASILIMLTGCVASLCVFSLKSLKPKGELVRGLVFFSVTAMLFSVLPIMWGAYPWHMSPTILFLSFVFGFSFEAILKIYFRNGVNVAWLVAMGIALITPLSNMENIHLLEKDETTNFNLRLNANAVFHPPLLRSQMKSDTIIVVEDSRGDAYSIGASVYPLVIYPSTSTTTFFLKHNNQYQVRLGMTYNGNLFKYAYLMPSLREEDFPFKFDQIEKLPDIILYNWIQNIDKIYSFGYDEKARWIDKTADFKKRVLFERDRRHLIANAYQEIPNQYLKASVLKMSAIPVEDPLLCQYECDKDKKCKSVTLLKTHHIKNEMPYCLLYSVNQGKQIFCDSCALYIKKG